MKYSHRLRWAILLSMCLLAGLGVSMAQQGTLGGLGGTIRDTTGAVVTGAKVTLRNVGTNETRTTASANDGSFTFSQIVSGTYAVVVEKEGFSTETFTDVQVLTGQQYSLSVKIKVGAKTETVEVVAGQDLIHTIDPEITNTVDQRQILDLPINGRNPIALIRDQAGVPGVLSANRNNTGINGGRPGWTEVTQDGINIQDNFIRNNGLDFVPNRPTSDTVSEFSIISNNVGADSVGGTSQVKLSTPSGTNAYHGSLYEYNRNNAFAANSFFNKHVQPGTTPVPLPDLNLNQYGVTVGGPILKNKLFFYTNYEGYRQTNGVTQSLVVPVNNNYLTGVYNYAPSAAGSAPVAANLLNVINGKAGTPGPLSISPFIQANVLSKIRGAQTANSFDCGDSIPGRLLNTTCSKFNQANTTNRDQAVVRLDYNLTQNHSFQMVVQRFTDFATRSDIDSFDPTPNAFIPTKARLFSGAWRWTITPNLLNEFRGGDNTVIAPFQTTYGVPQFLFTPAQGTRVLDGLGLQNPTDNFAPQGRFVTTRQYGDNATWNKGKHNIAFGLTYQAVQPHPYDFQTTMPSITFGFSTGTANSAYQVTNADLAKAGLPATDQTTLNNMSNYLAFMSGTITQVTQSFEVQNLSAGYVPGIANKRAYDFSILAPYFQDHWHVLSNLTVTAGLKWEYWSPIEEASGLALLPNITGTDLQGSLLNPSGTVSPHKHFWNPDYKVFGPNVGFAWDPFKNGKTSVRGGYSLAYVNEDEVTAGTNAIGGNFGLVAPILQNNLATKIDAGIPTLTPPPLSTNRAFSQQLVDSGPNATAFAIQPNLRTPHVHEFNFSLERQLPWNTAIEARYVGTLGRNLWRGVDFNQQLSGNNPAYMADFQRAQSNLFNCGAAIAPGNCAAGQQLTFFPRVTNAMAFFKNATVVADLKQGIAGDLANLYVSNPGIFTNARQVFLPNPNIFAADALMSNSVSDYHALQVEARHNLKNGLTAQLNYTFSKNLADAAGNSQARFEPFIDNARHGIDYGRSEFDVTHIVNGNLVYEFPFGRGKQFLSGANGFLDRVVSGWTTGHIIRWESGSPFTILSSRGTFNRAGRSTNETAVTTLTKSQLKGMLGLFNQNGTIYWINPSVINPANGRAVGTVNGGFDPLTNTPTFQGQVFFNPQAGQVGNLPRLQFDGPANYTWDMSMAKRTKITERINTEFRADIFNVLNTATFFFGDTNINSTNFGKITSTGNNPRVMQLSLRVTF
ncbi:MAG TPA: TonB-dependent receptor [Candidatus Angelobacter sp.]|nr:TonB-dependent receptor [Candidatus Angelobacter sp.]